MSDDHSSPRNLLADAEKYAQTLFCDSDWFPVHLYDLTEQQLADLGLVLGDTVPDTRDQMRHATLPEGWRRVPSDTDTRYSHVVDGQGRPRLLVYYVRGLVDEAFARPLAADPRV